MIAACEACKEAVWLQRLIAELEPKHSQEPVKMFCDNQSSIRLIKNPELHQRTKHIEVKYFFVRDIYEQGKITVKYVDSDNQLADILTKPLPKIKHQDLSKKLGLEDQTQT